jgi:hypothetical protein
LCLCASKNLKTRLRSISLIAMTVKSSAGAHGFHHMGEFSGAYRTVIGEMPSKTLADARAARSIQIDQADVEQNSCPQRLPFSALGSAPDTCSEIDYRSAAARSGDPRKLHNSGNRRAVA